MIWPNYRTFVGCLLAFGLTLTYCRVASAQTSGSAAARALFDEGRRLLAEGQYAEACPKLEESLRLQEGTGTKFNLADCYEKLGRTASAWSLFLEVAGETKTRGETEREVVARERAEALKPRLSRIVIQVEEPRPEQRVLLDGIEVGEASWGLEVPIDPGQHRLLSEGEGFETFEATVDIPESPGLAPVVIPTLVPKSKPAPEGAASAEEKMLTTPEAGAGPNDASPSPAVAPAVPVAPRVEVPAASPQAAPDDPQSRWSGRKIATYSAFGAGAIGVLVGTIFGLRTDSKERKSGKICPSGFNCTQDEIESYRGLIRQAKQARAVSYVGFALGIVSVGAGTALLLTGKDRKKNQESNSRALSGWSIALDAGPTSWGLRFWGKL